MSEIWEVFPGEPGYPPFLGSLPDAPRPLFVRGRLDPEADGVAVVGSRRPTQYGRRMASRLAKGAAAQGLVVVSGLARGIDGEAHRAALEEGGLTWAVLGSGLDRIYPAEHAGLAEAIVAKGGCLISQFKPGSTPLPECFPQRNRVIAALAWATVVVEGRFKSGALITAKEALDLGREVFAVPGPADSPLSEAPHLLLSRGASLATSFNDILDALPPGCRVKPTGGQAEPARGVAPTGGVAEQERIMACLGADSLPLEELVYKTGLDLQRLSHILLGMELQELVISLEGQRYAKKV